MYERDIHKHREGFDRELHYGFLVAKITMLPEYWHNFLCSLTRCVEMQLSISPEIFPPPEFSIYHLYYNGFFLLKKCYLGPER